jgi:hypothetical protein
MYLPNIRQVCLVATSLLVLAAALPASCVTDSANPGCVHFEWKTSSSTDQYTNTPNSTQQQWFQEHMYRIMGYQGYWNYRLNWFANSWVYQDSSALYYGSSIANQHPEWILKNRYGTKLFVNWNCHDGHCDQYIPDYSNEGFRQWWISQARSAIYAGFRGVFVDDVNLVMNLSNGYGQDTPIDNNTGQPMTQQAWEQYFADFLTEIRNALPSAEIVHNALWYAGNFSPASDPFVMQEIQAADYINLERGFADSGLTNAGSWSIQNLFSYIDTVHQAGKHILAGQYGFDGQFSLAAYFLINDGKDLFSNDSITPLNWPAMYDVDLGTPLGDRRAWNGLIRRDFSKGIALINPPNSATVTVDLPGSFTDLNGNPLTTLTLAGRQGAILLGTVQTTGPLADGTYQLTNQNSKLVLDDANQSKQPGNAMIQWANNGGKNQFWNFVWNGSGYYTIQNQMSQLYLTSGGVQMMPLTQQAGGNNDTQLWSLKRSGSNYFIINKATGMAIDDPNFDKTQGLKIVVWPLNGGINQIWSIH